jgi:ketosteroid isomerase-like protein
VKTALQARPLLILAHNIAARHKPLHRWRAAEAKVVESGDQAVGEMTYRGTQTGPLVGPAGEIPPTGKSVELRGAAWITIRDGRIARFDGYYDTMSMMVQLGLMPAPATA